MPSFTYVKHIVIMGLQWSTASFSFYLVQFMTKYYEGNLFLNYYLDGAAGLVGITIAYPIYACLQIRWSFILSLSLTIVFVLFLCLFQQRVISPSFIKDLGAPESPYEPGSEQDQEHYLSYLIPGVVFIAKMFINTTFLFVYQVSFNEDIIFPFYKRATANGVCNFFARLLTVFAPLIAETPRPVPAIFLLVLNSIALVASIFLPSRQEEDEFEAKYNFKKVKTD